jgi:FkbH-like protein
MMEVDRTDVNLTKAEWQQFLFKKVPKRLELQALNPDWKLMPVKIRTHRNHAFEHVISAARGWFAFWDREPVVDFGDYDDSLSFSEVTSDEKFDLEVLWLDADRYLAKFSEKEFSEWLGARVQALRSVSAAPILVVVIGLSDAGEAELKLALSKIPGVRLGEVGGIADELGARFIDMRASKFSGTRLSDIANILIAREASCRWIPAMLIGRPKVLVLDLDHTLYQGVLGEDGPEGVELTEGHRALQEVLLDLAQQGLFLGIASKNEAADVRRLFEVRTDFPLKWEHFNATAIGWGGKAEGIRKICSALRISEDSAVFVDDNPGEIAAVVSEIPAIGILHAAPDGLTTRMALEFYPGLWRWDANAEDLIRSSDLAANDERAELASHSSSPEEYLKSLNVVLKLSLNDENQLQRLVELSQKTNQFNLNLSRYSEVDFARLFKDDEVSVVALSLSDRLSESGIIGLIVARQDPFREKAQVEELAISCRALGRGLEDMMIAAAMNLVLDGDVGKKIVFSHKTGPRNGPSREWLEKWCVEPFEEEGVTEIHNLLENFPDPCPIEIQVINNGK